MRGVTPALIIAPPRGGGPAARYTAEAVVRGFLGVPFAFEDGEGAGWRITSPGRAGSMAFADTFFARAAGHWLAPDTLPLEPPRLLAIEEVPFTFRNRGASIPLLCADPVAPGVSAGAGTNAVEFGFDLFASAFLMLSRYEEAVASARDAHGRFSAQQSLAARHDFLERPVVHEWSELLAGALEHLWPGTVPERQSFRMRVTCDVDYAHRHTRARTIAALRHAAGDLVKRGSPGGAAGHLRREGEALSLRSSPYNDLLWVMEENERAGNRVAFYFLAGRTDPRFDNQLYKIDDAPTAGLLRQVNKRGHEIGLHNSYGTLGDAEAIGKERRRLEEACASAGLPESPIGVRAHFLRYDPLLSPAAFEAAGLVYDTTLGFADAVGFRCGACQPYPMFDLTARRPLPVIERPLIAAEFTLLQKSYMGVTDLTVAASRLSALKDACRWAGGEFTLLWHNCFPTGGEREVYRALIN